MKFNWRKIADGPPTDGSIIMGCNGDGDDFVVYEMAWEPTLGMWSDPGYDGTYQPTHWAPRLPQPSGRRAGGLALWARRASK